MCDMVDVNILYKSLVESLKFLAAPYNVQITILPEFAVLEDELIMDFQEAFQLIPRIIEKNMLSKKAIAAIIDCYLFVDRMWSKEELFTREALESSPQWQRARDMAIDALSKMKIENLGVDKKWV